MKQKIIKYTFITLGAALLANAVVASCLANMHLGIVLTYLIGAVLSVLGAFWNFVSAKIHRAVGYSVLCLLCAFIVCAAFVFVYGSFDTVDYTEDAVIVLGTGLRGEAVSGSLKSRLDSAYEYYNKNLECVIVVSGGKGTQEQISEAEGMARYLLSLGVPSDKIIKEELSTSTQENFENSKILLDGHFDGEYTVGVISNDYHLFRAVMIAKELGYEGIGTRHGDTPWYIVIPSGIREVLATAKQLLMSDQRFC